MKTLETIKLYPAANVLRSKRFQNSSDNSGRNAVPTLIIGDTISSATKLFIAKTRSEIGGLDVLLKTLTGSALKTK